MSGSQLAIDRTTGQPRLKRLGSLSLDQTVGNSYFKEEELDGGEEISHGGEEISAV
ncbi:hypothetical protein KEM48_006670 [Puccinia striiformis f. sp. tritici PST-130]|nr:hypothetical protein KEM48_006670 [Puccinia striiformis f. sp. tritici PST-130]